MDYAHLFRSPDGIVHAVLCNKPSIKRNGRHHAVCGLRIDYQVTRISPHRDIGRTAPITCDKDLLFMTALSTIVDEDEENHD